MKNPRTEQEMFETLDDLQTTLEVLVAHLGLEEQVQRAIADRHAKAEEVAHSRSGDHWATRPRRERDSRRSRK